MITKSEYKRSSIQTYFLSDFHPTRIVFFFRLLLWIAGAGLLLWMLYFLYRTVIMPYPITYREGAQLTVTQILMQGENPYSLEYQPVGFNLYGIGYSAFVTPFALLFGNTLAVHRVATLFFLLCVYVYAWITIYRHNKDLLIALIFCSLILAVLSGYGENGAYPSAMGVFIMLLAVLIPFAFSFSFPSLLASVAFSVLVYYVKPYFLLSVGVVASYLFLFVSKKKGALYFFIFVLAFIGVYIPVRYKFEWYFIDTILGSMANTKISSSHLNKQLVVLTAQFYLTLIAAFITLLVNLPTIKSFKNLLRDHFPCFDILSIEQPLISKPINYFAYFFICSTLVFVLLLGLHTGAYMTYAYQLIVPPFLLWFSMQIKAHSRISSLVSILALINLFLIISEMQHPAYLSQATSKEWARLYEYARQSGQILNSPVIVPVMIEQGLLPVDSGQTQYFSTIQGRDYRAASFGRNENILLGPSYFEVKAISKKYHKNILTAVQDAKYDLIIITHRQYLIDYIYEDLPKTYTLVETILVKFPQYKSSTTVEIWKPISSP